MMRPGREKGWCLARALWAACAGAVVSAASAFTPPFIVQEVAPGNFVHPGKHVPFGDRDHDDIANIGFIVGEKCVAVIDTGGSIVVGRQLKQAIRSKTQLPICFVINTHVHPDHVLGNQAFRDDKPQFIGHAGLPEAFETNRDYFLKNFGQDLGAHPSADEIIGPDKTVDATFEIDLGGRKLMLKAWPKAHTSADLSVFDEGTGTLWLGDLLFRERLPSLDGSIEGWLGVINELQDQPVKTVVPGHGPVSNDLKAALVDERRYLQLLVDQVRVIIAQGGTIEQAMERVGTSEQGHWQLWDQHHRRNVSRTFTELEWE